jgi:hypothetical protein
MASDLDYSIKINLFWETTLVKIEQLLTAYHIFAPIISLC